MAVRVAWMEGSLEGEVVFKLSQRMRYRIPSGAQNSVEAGAF